MTAHSSIKNLNSAEILCVLGGIHHNYHYTNNQYKKLICIDEIDTLATIFIATFFASFAVSFISAYLFTILTTDNNATNKK